MEHTTKITREENQGEGAFRIDVDGAHAGIMTYHYSDEGDMVIDHTVVKEEYEGQGLARKLVYAGVDFARETGLKIIPLCPYANALMHKNAQYHDVLKGGN